jgi:hypothetical protein
MFFTEEEGREQGTVRIGYRKKKRNPFKSLSNYWVRWWDSDFWLLASEFCFFVFFVVQLFFWDF